MKELKPVQYGAWTIKIRKSSSKYESYYEYKIEFRGEDISRGWVSIYSNNKDRVVAIAKEAVDTHYKKKVLIGEHGDVLRQKYDQFRGAHFG